MVILKSDQRFEIASGIVEDCLCYINDDEINEREKRFRGRFVRQSIDLLESIGYDVVGTMDVEDVGQ